MNVTDLSNYTPVYGRGAKLHRELTELVRYFSVHPNSAADVAALFEADAAKVVAALKAAVPVVPVASVAAGSAAITATASGKTATSVITVTTA